MVDKNKRKIDWLLILPGSLLLIEGIVVSVLISSGYKISQPMIFFLVLLAGYLVFQLWQHLSTRFRVQNSVNKINDGKVMVESGQPFEALKLWKELLLNLPRENYLDVLAMLEEVYLDQEMNAGIQQIKAIRSESLNFFEMTRETKKATAKDRKDWQAKAFAVRQMIKALPTEPDQELSDVKDENNGAI